MIPYTPPKLVSRGTSAIEPKGKGTVVVQVLVNANGSFKVMRVLSSTNPADDAAAMDIAKHSQYAPATRSGKKVPNFFDFSIAFGDNVVSGAAAEIDTLLHQNRWSDAKTAAAAALAKDPNDALVQAQLGVADAFTHDVAGSVAAFEHAGKIPAQYAGVALQAYALQSQSVVSADPKTALTLAQKAVALGDDYSAYYALGLAQRANGDDADARISLEKAKTLAEAARPPADTATRANIDEALLGLANGRGDSAEAASLTKELQSIDPGLSQKTAAYSDDEQGVALQKRGDVRGAIQMFDAAAAADPAWAGAPEHTKAAIIYATISVPDFLSARKEADAAIAADPKYALAYYVKGVVLAEGARVSGNGNDMQDANMYLNQAADLARKNGLDKLAQAAEYFAQNHEIDANLQFWSTQITTKPGSH